MKLNKKEYEETTQKMVDGLKVFDEAIDTINVQLAVLGEVRHNLSNAILTFTANNYPEKGETGD